MAKTSNNESSALKILSGMKRNEEPDKQEPKKTEVTETPVKEVSTAKKEEKETPKEQPTKAKPKASPAESKKTSQPAPKSLFKAKEKRSIHKNILLTKTSDENLRNEAKQIGISVNELINLIIEDRYS